MRKCIASVMDFADIASAPNALPVPIDRQGGRYSFVKREQISKDSIAIDVVRQEDSIFIEHHAIGSKYPQK